MKTKTRAPRVTLCAAAAALSFAALHAQTDGVWTNNAGGSWSDPKNWLDGIVPNGAGSIVTFPNNPGGHTLQIDAPVTVGKFNINTVGSGWNFTLAPGGSLTMDNGAATPEFFFDPSADNNSWFNMYAPFTSTNGVWVGATQRSNVTFFEANDITGVFTPGQRNYYCRIAHPGVFGSAVVNPMGGVVLDLNQGMTFTNDIILAGAEIHSAGITSGNNPATLTGNITLAGGSSIWAGRNSSTPLIINGPITGTDPAAGITFRAGGGGGTITINAPININGANLNAGNNSNGAIFMQDASGPTIYLNEKMSYQGRLLIRGGTLVCGKPYVLDNQNIVGFVQADGDNQILNLNGFDQRVGGIHLGINNVNRISRVTSATPATLTLDIPQGVAPEMNYRNQFEGPLTVVKTGPGAQILTGGDSVNLIDQWVAEEGSFEFRWGTYSANLEVRGGWLHGGNGGPIMVFRIDGNTPDKMILTSGALDVSKMNVVFTGFPDYGEHLILDATAGGVFTSGNTDPKLPFNSVSDLPEGCLLKVGGDKKQIWLVRPRPGALMMIK